MVEFETAKGTKITVSAEILGGLYDIKVTANGADVSLTRDATLINDAQLGLCIKVWIKTIPVPAHAADAIKAQFAVVAADAEHKTKYIERLSLKSRIENSDGAFPGSKAWWDGQNAAEDLQKWDDANSVWLAEHKSRV